MTNITQKQLEILTDLYNDTQKSYDRLMDYSIKEKDPTKRKHIVMSRYGRLCQINMFEKICNALGLEVDYDVETDKHIIKELIES